jgi:hypothetical protein
VLDIVTRPSTRKELGYLHSMLVSTDQRFEEFNKQEESRFIAY